MDSYKAEKLKLDIQEKEVEVREFFMGLPRSFFYLIIALLILTIPIFFVSRAVTAKIVNNSYANDQAHAQSAVFTSQPVQILSSKILTMVGNSYAAYALIKNPNPDLVTEDLRYTFSFLDANGQEISSVTDSDFMLGGEQKYIVVPQVTLSQTPTSVKVTIPDPVWKKRISLPNVIIQNSIPTYGDQFAPTGYFLAGTIENLSPYTLETIRMTGIIFDKSHNVIAVSQTSTNAVKSQESRDYKMYWPVPLSSSVGSAPQVIVETNILDLSNLK